MSEPTPIMRDISLQRRIRLQNYNYFLIRARKIGFFVKRHKKEHSRALEFQYVLRFNVMEGTVCYAFRTLRCPAVSRTVICWIAIWLSLCRRSG